MGQAKGRVQRLTLLAMMIALDVVLSPLLRIEGMAPMSSVMNIVAGVLLGPWYATIMAVCCGVIRMALLGIPPLALTGAVFGAFLAGVGYRLRKRVGGNHRYGYHWVITVLSGDGLVYRQ